MKRWRIGCIPRGIDENLMTAKNGKTVALRSVGCRTNQEEITLLGAELAARGYRLMEEITEADVVVINTCSVTSCSESKTRRLIGAVARKAPRARLLVTGCLAQQRPEALAADPRIRWVVGNAHKDRIASIIDNVDGAVFHSRPDAPVWGGEAIPDTNDTPRTRFPLKIQEGCNYTCAYCIVPSLRGPARSRPWTEVIERCIGAADAGFREIVLTGTHIGQYRDGARGLAELVEEMLGLSRDFRIRLSSLDPRDVTPRLLDLVAGDTRLCPHLHVSVQSLCGTVLKAMGRPYADHESFAVMLHEFRRKAPRVAVGGDFIVGFPGESDGMFETTRGWVERIGFCYGHVFRYSPRPGTPAATFTNQIDEQEKRRRSRLLINTVRSTRRRFVESVIGVRERIIVEKRSPVMGVTGNYIRVELPETSARRGEWLTIVPSDYDARRDRCRATVVAEENV
ncbi:MAG: MiaB/RimO family radical SAM methylthiotransferase [Chitinivibrionales bacterium]|nr:MiaB/RimO family radical SAM methylthiotransferase [Chitinivibrionales bacterium]MBD3356972.1 MiaB/RimO family radical SAM methylthiotransferase [Chitinivibrionales bacterium]